MSTKKNKYKSQETYYKIQSEGLNYLKVKIKQIQNGLVSSVQLSNFLLSLLMWTWGGTVYFFMEVVYKTLTGHPDHISWTMIIVAFVLCIPLERFGDELPWEMPMYLQSLISAVGITVVELISGIILNIWLGLNVWDYSQMKFNFMGQICLQFFFVWIILSYFGIKIFDWIRFIIIGGIKPNYSKFRRHQIKNKTIYRRNYNGNLCKFNSNEKKENKEKDNQKLENEINEIIDKIY